MSMVIRKAGALSTVQDEGRFGVMKTGFGQCGAMDLTSMHIANRLVGNCINCAVIEMTLIGITAVFNSECIIALSGGDFSAVLSGKHLRCDKAYVVRAGDELKIGAAKTGARCYLAVSGGIDVPKVMGSRSTDIKMGIGGYCGRKLKAGDVLNFGKNCMTVSNPDKWEIEQRVFSGNYVLRAILGPQDFLFPEETIEKFFGSEYKVTHECDRMGVRLSGEALKAKDSVDIISDGIVRGSVQVPGSGQPIVLMSDHQTVGGYAKIATVISQDVSLLAQAKPGDKIRFERISVEQAEKLAKKEKKYLDNLFFW